MPTGGINYLPSGFEPIAQGIEAIGAGLGKNLFLDKQRQIRMQDEIASNPELAGQFATQIRRAGGPEAAAQALGVDAEFLRNIERSSPPGFEESVEDLMLTNPDAVPTFAKARIAEAKAVGAEAGAREQVAIGSENLNRTLNMIGAPQAKALLEAKGIELNTEQADFALQEFDKYAEFVQSLPERDRKRFGYAMFAPGFLQDVQFREDLSLRDHIAHLQAQAQQSGWGSLDPGELFGLYSKFQDQTSKAIGDLLSAQETGDKEQIRVAEARVNDLMRAAQQFLPPGLVGTLFEAEGKGKRTRFNIFDLTSVTPEQKAITAIRSGEATREDLFNSQYWQNLTPEKRQELVNGMSATESVSDLPILEGWQRVMQNSFLGNIAEGLQQIQVPTPEGRGRIY